jgi:uncharacterized protein
VSAEAVRFLPRTNVGEDWELLPVQFDRLVDERVVLTNMVGEHLIVGADELEALIAHDALSPLLMRQLMGKHIVRRVGDELPIELLAMKVRTRNNRLADFTALHMFVVTLRCEHACHYCQVSRQGSSHHEYDMSSETASKSLDFVFRSPAAAIKIEFQGGEPLLNFERVREIVVEAEDRNAVAGKRLAFVIATNLALLDDDVIEFARDHELYFSTSLDGPRQLHNRNRPRPGADSWERTIAGIHRIQNELGHHRVGALMTTTDASLTQPEAIIDAYVSMGLHDVFLRPISPYGFAMRPTGPAHYDADVWLRFYKQGLIHILDLNRRGTPVVELYAALVLKKILTNEDPGYVDLRSPSGIGIGGIVYNYDGDIYAADEGRMLAEMGDTTFRLGNVHTASYVDVMTSEPLLDALDESFAYSAPMCNDCAFETYCGADPVYHHATFGDPVGIKPTSAFCRRNMGVFHLLLDLYHGDPDTRSLFRRWANR